MTKLSLLFLIAFIGIKAKDLSKVLSSILLHIFSMLFTSFVKSLITGLFLLYEIRLVLCKLFLKSPYNAVLKS